MTRHGTVRWAAGMVLPLVLGSLTLAAPAPPAPARPATIPTQGHAATEEFFESHIRPVLLASCGRCHGESLAQGGLRVDSREALLKGGKRGPALRPGDPSGSLLLQVLAGTPLRMPPDGELRLDRVARLREWVAAGAPWPKTEKSAAAGPHWSFEPIASPAPPPVRNRAWVRQPVDAFILHRLERRGWQPAPTLDRRRLIRRVTLDVTGLLPTPEETDQFVADRHPDAYARLVDRLLASPHYGERWGRYWLDLVRYADTNGYERDAEKAHSWKYRDYVVRSLNEDRPYDRFVTEQLAGDELPQRTEETVTATGFLRLGTWDDEPNDPLEYRYERMEDLVHATGTAFLALTVKCARCHDHKFDPIPQKDYYALGAAFQAGYLDPGDRALAGGPPPDRLGFPVLGFTDSSPSPRPLHLLHAGDPRREGPVVEPGYLSVLTPRLVPDPPPAIAGATSGRRLRLARWITDPRNPLTARVLVNRLWQHHFGAGLVRTPNNFGRKGSPPTHPELLDFLARQLLTPSPQGSGWRLKPLHRMLLLSSTYQMDSRHPKEAEYRVKDYDNTYWWRAQRRRLDADALHDTLLQVSGRLNLAIGGRGYVPTVSAEALEGLSRKGAEWQPSDPDQQNRRSIYMFLKRALLMPLLTVFDFPDTTTPVEQRDATIVAPQALALLNNHFVHQQSRALARRLRQDLPEQRPAQVSRLWKLVTGRAPTPSEVGESLRYLDALSDSPKISSPEAPADLMPSDAPALWLRADRGIVRDDAGRVLRWEDQSGAARHAVPPTAAARPEWVNGVPNRSPAVRLNGKGQFFSVAGPVLTSQQFTLIAVAMDREPGTTHREIFSNWNGAGGNVGTSLFLGTTGRGTIRFSDHFLAGPPEELMLTQPRILTAVNGAAHAELLVDRQSVARRGVPLPPRNLSPPYVVGQQGTIQGEFWNGDLFELLVFDRALSDETLGRVHAMLAARHQVAQPPSPAESALASLCHALLNTNEFLFTD